MVSYGPRRRMATCFSTTLPWKAAADGLQIGEIVDYEPDNDAQRPRAKFVKRLRDAARRQPVRLGRVRKPGRWIRGAANGKKLSWDSSRDCGLANGWGSFRRTRAGLSYSSAASMSLGYAPLPGLQSVIRSGSFASTTPVNLAPPWLPPCSFTSANPRSSSWSSPITRKPGARSRLGGSLPTFGENGWQG